MKKFLTFAVTIVAAFAALASSASATITDPVGTAVTGSGTVTLRGAIISTSCAIAVRGSVTGSTSASLSSVAFSGCGSGASISVLGLPWRKTITLSPRAFTISGVQVELSAPIIGTCLYSGTISGTYVPGSPTALTITSDALTFVRGASICSRDPTVTGSISASTRTV